MGKKESWISAVKKVLGSESKEKNEKNIPKSKKKWFGKQKNLDLDSAPAENVLAIPEPPSPIKEVKLAESANGQSQHTYPIAVAENEQGHHAYSPAVAENEQGQHAYSVPVAENEQRQHAYSVAVAENVRGQHEYAIALVDKGQNQHAYSVALATAMAAEAAVAAAQAAAEVVRLASVSSASLHSGRSKEKVAAVKIQTAYRGYMARRALQASRGLMRLKSLLQGQSVKRQAATTLRCMQTLARVQSQIHARRIRMSEENHSLQRLHELKREKEFEKLRTSTGEGWDIRMQSKEQIEANRVSKQEAAKRRERALAYAYSQQQTWRNSAKSANSTFMDPNNPHWGWSWLERWMAARPWENRSTTDRELSSDHASTKSPTSHAISVGEISKTYSRCDSDIDNKHFPAVQKPIRPTNLQSPSSPSSKATTASSVARKTRPGSPRANNFGAEYCSRSTLSFQAEKNRRHSIAVSSAGDDESLPISPTVRSYMTPTKNMKTRSKLSSPLGLEKNGTPEKGSVGCAKKRLSFPSAPAGPRRHSVPPKINTGAAKDINVRSEVKVNNGGGR